MRKNSLFAALLAAGILLLVSGCGGQETASSAPASTTQTTSATEAPLVPLDVYKAAQEKYEGQKTISYSFDMKMSVSASGITMDIGSSGKIGTIVADADSEMAADMTMNMLGQEIKANSYYKNGVLYTQALGMKIKQPLPFDEAVDEIGAPTMEYTPDDIKDIKAVRKDDTIVLTFTVSADTALATMSEDMLASAGIDETAMDSVEITDVQVEYVVDKDGEFISCKTVFSMSATAEEQKTTISYDFAITDIQYGADVKITPPADLDAYVEADDIGGDQAL